MKYSERFDLPQSAKLFMSGEHAIWNPSRGSIAIYGALLTSRVMLPLQPFIAQFLEKVRIAPAPLNPNSYQVLISLWHMWKQIGAKFPRTPEEIRNFYTLGQSDNGGTFHLQPSSVNHWIPPGATQTTWEARDRLVLFVEKDLLKLELFHSISNRRKRLYEMDIVASKTPKKVKNLDRANRAEAAAQPAQGIALRQQNMVEHTYKLNPNTASGASDWE
ncbi:hypothetical protein Dsin_018682 [Dipteronia sinensis]|uniref:Uncharacterized protein n=1 Tax=Dipteronia sinensis TaxID=43782 RepID=A0AAE0A5X9_9ROSI|nr:hypothetical protein Dsin_018682 [Dipteronia sinensis]